MPYKISTSHKHSVFKEWQPALLKGPGSLDAHIASGKPLPPDMVTWLADHKLILEKREDKLPSIIGWALGPFFVTGAVRQIIEKLEPDIHHFYEVNAFHKVDGKPVANKYYMLVISQAVSGVDLDKSNTEIDHINKNKIWLKLGGNWSCYLVKEKIGSFHLWKDDQLPRQYFCSDKLKQEIESIQAEGWDFLTCTAQ